VTDAEPAHRVVTASLVKFSPSAKSIKARFKDNGQWVYLSCFPGRRRRVACVDGNAVLTNIDASNGRPKLVANIALLVAVNPDSSRKVVRWGVIPDPKLYTMLPEYLGGSITIETGTGTTVAEGILASFAFPDGMIEVEVRSEDGLSEGTAASSRTVNYPAECAVPRDLPASTRLIIDITMAQGGAKICLQKPKTT